MDEKYYSIKLPYFNIIKSFEINISIYKGYNLFLNLITC